ncbi:MAG: T9SS type A sorting domain-containing protein [Candidatus Azobacteroides sp.]|nr:T9SS type A sorting domain-containing protein [Candidatus Azobacteroides sp.]
MKPCFYITVLWLSGMTGMLRSQHALQSSLNFPRAGEEIIKQQVEYKNPGRSGAHVLWDFGQLNSVNDQYTLSYSEPVAVNDSMYILGLDTIFTKNLTEGKLLTGTEHHTMYYYYLTDNRWWVLGHENPTTLLQYTKPLIAVCPIHYQDSCRYDYQSEGLYSSGIPFTSDGNVQIRADAYGMMILPSGDTLRNVLRTRTSQTIHQVIRTGDSGTVEQSSSVETYKWYSKGYRYPIFETVRTAVMADTTETVNFETAFFFPPQEHYYLEDDPENSAMWEKDPDPEIGGPQNTDPWAGLTYNFYPNPAVTNLEVEVYLPRTAHVRMQLTNRPGQVVWSRDFGVWREGINTVQIFVSPFPTGEYVLNMWFDGYMTGEKILKK